MPSHAHLTRRLACAAAVAAGVAGGCVGGPGPATGPAADRHGDPLALRLAEATAAAARGSAPAHLSVESGTAGQDLGADELGVGVGDFDFVGGRLEHYGGVRTTLFGNGPVQPYFGAGATVVDGRAAFGWGSAGASLDWPWAAEDADHLGYYLRCGVELSLSQRARVGLDLRMARGAPAPWLGFGDDVDSSHLALLFALRF